MHLKKLLLFSVVALLTMPLATFADNTNQIKHVLLISVDGLHAVDVAQYVESHPKSALAQLSQHAITYTNANTPANSDSFPGLLALVTGGSPLSHGLFYDVSYDRTIFDPSNTTCKGPAGTQMIFDESIDLYKNGVSQNVIDPNSLPRHLVNGKCVPMFPHDAIRTNTIFEVVKAAGGRTAWADKHPAYDLVNGPSGIGVDDLYTPELTNAFGGFDNTVSVVCTARNDQLKVTGVLNEIHGLTHDGKKRVGIPAVFGMNFQAVSVGQKLAHDNTDGSCQNDALSGQPGGYLAGTLAPTEVLQYGLENTDEALGDMIEALQEEGIYNETLFIVSAKHGQSPINPLKTNKPGHFGNLVAALPDSNTDPGGIAINAANNCPGGSCGFVQDDDIALIWLGDQSKTAAAAQYLNKNAPGLFIEEVMAGNDLTLKFNSPQSDSRVPDIIVQPIQGTIYTGSTAKNAEHGGFSFSDRNVGLIVSNPGFSPRVIKTPVASSEVAPSILKALGLDPNALQSVQKEHTPVLPGLFDVAATTSSN
jgi:hypothetical protein